MVEDKIQINCGVCLHTNFHQAKKEDIEIP